MHVRLFDKTHWKRIGWQKRLLVIRDAELNLLSFEVLEYQPKKHMLSRFTISYNYAASLLFTEAENRNSNLKILSFAPVRRAVDFKESIAWPKPRAVAIL